MQQLTVIQDYVLKAMLHHRIIRPLGDAGTVWAGVDFSRDVGVLSNEREVVRDLYEALEDWLLTRLRNGERVPVVDGIDLNSEEGQKLVAWHERHPTKIDPDQAWFWTQEWQAGEREASREIEAGETTLHATGEDFLASFDGEDSPN
jgi:hypothetical protein